MLGLHVVEDGGDPLQRGGHREQAQRVTGGRGVPRPGGPGTCAGQARPPHQADQLVDAGEGRPQEAVDVVLVEVGSPLEDRPEQAPAGGDPAVERAVGVELHRLQRSPPGGDPARARGERALEGVAQGMRGVGRHQEHPVAPLGGGDGGAGGAGGLAHAALATEEAVVRSYSSSSQARASTPVTFIPPGPAPVVPARISRSRARISRSNCANSSSLISPSSRRIWAASSSSRSALSSLSSASASWAIFDRTNLSPPNRRESRMITGRPWPARASAGC